MRITTTEYEKQYIFEQISAVKPVRALEIGAYQGKTTRVISDAVAPQDGYVIVFDPMKWSSTPADMLERMGGWLQVFRYEGPFWKYSRAGGHENVRLIRAFSNDEKLIARKDPTLQEFDAIFIDGDHTYPFVKLDLENWGRRVRKGGRILLHDAIPRFDGVIKAVKEWEGDERVRITWPEKDTVAMIEVLEDLREGPSPAESAKTKATAEATAE